MEKEERDSRDRWFKSYPRSENDKFWHSQWSSWMFKDLQINDIETKITP